MVTGRGSVATNGQAIFNASGSQNVTEYAWSVGSGGESIRTSLPVLALRTPLPGTYPIRLTTVSTGGQTATTSTTLKVTGKPPPKSLPNAALPPPIATAAGGADFFRPAQPEDALKTCKEATVVFGLVEAKACFSRINDITKVPTAERKVVKRHYETEGFNGLVNTLCAQAARGVTPQSKCDEARAYFGSSPSELDVYVSKGPVKFNGLTISPRAGARVVVYPKQERIISSRATVSWGSFPIKPVPKAVDFHIKGPISSGGKSKGSASPPRSTKKVFPTGSRKFFTFDAKKALSSIGRFSVQGGNLNAELYIRAANGRRFSTAEFTLTVPLLKAFGGQSPTLRTTLQSDIRGRVIADEISALLPQANLGAIRLRNLSFKYRREGRIDNDFNEGTTCPSKEWKIRGEVLFGIADGAVKLTPPPPQNGLGFCEGGFKHFGAQVDLPNPKPILFPGVQLNHINFAVGLNPLLFRGGAGLEVAKVNRVNGEVVAVFASPGAPYRFGPGDRQYFRDLQGLDPFKSTTFAVGGEVFTRIPIFGDIRLGEGAILYSYPDYFAFGGKASFTAALITVEGGLSGWFRFGSGKFQLGGGIRACLALPKPFRLCRGASAYVGSRGISACIEAFGLDVGAGYRWGESFPVLMLRNNCKHSPFWERNTARASATSDSFTIARGEKNKEVMVRGAGGASPSIEVRSPSGEVVSTAGNPMQNGKTMSVLRLEKGATYIGVENGRPGRYTIKTLPGSAELGRIATTRPGYDTNFKARVVGKGAVRTLVYDARKRGGQSVTFVERGARVARPLKTVKGGKGSFRFKPSVVPGRARTIVALSTLNGYAIPDQTLARFRAPAIPRTGRPRKLSVRRKGTVLRVRWRKARGAKRYGVTLRLSNGKMRFYTLSRRRTSLRIRRVPRDSAGRVEVSAQGVLLDWGKARSKRFRRLERPFSVEQTNRINEKRQLAQLRRAAEKRKAAKRKKARRKRALGGQLRQRPLLGLVLGHPGRHDPDLVHVLGGDRRARVGRGLQRGAGALAQLGLARGQRSPVRHAAAHHPERVRRLRSTGCSAVTSSGSAFTARSIPPRRSSSSSRRSRRRSSAAAAS